MLTAADLLRRRERGRARDPRRSPTRSTAASTGTGRRTAAPRSPTAGGRRAGSSLSVGGLRRGAAAVRARPRIADAPAARGELRRLAVHLSSGRQIYDHELLYAGPLFIHQLSHVWIDFRGIGDEFVRDRGIDYFENSRRATLRPAALRDRQPTRVRRLRRLLLGLHRERRARRRNASASTGSNGASSTTTRAASRSAPTTGRSRPGRRSPRCRSHPRSSCRRCGAFTTSASGRSPTRTGPASIPPSPRRPTDRTAGSRHTSSASTRAPSS